MRLPPADPAQDEGLTTWVPGNANIEGLSEDLGLTGTQYNIALSIFFIPYVLCGKAPPVPTSVVTETVLTIV